MLVVPVTRLTSVIALKRERVLPVSVLWIVLMPLVYYLPCGNLNICVVISPSRCRLTCGAWGYMGVTFFIVMHGTLLVGWLSFASRAGLWRALCWRC